MARVQLKNRAYVNTTVSNDNAAWLEAQAVNGKTKADALDEAITGYRAQLEKAERKAERRARKGGGDIAQA